MYNFAILFKLLRAFGLMPGLLAYLKFVKDRLHRPNSSATYTVSIPGSDRVATLRVRCSDWVVFDQVFVRGEYKIASVIHDTAVRNIYNNILSSGRIPLIIDCGANIGLASVFFKAEFPKAEIYAVEPDSRNFEILKRNITGLPGVFGVKAGVWHRDAKLRIHNSGTADHWGLQVTEAQGDHQPDDIDAIAVPQLLSIKADYALFIVKIDIEGSEREMMRNNNEWVDETPLIIAETHDWMLPWRGTGHSLFSVTTRRVRDYLLQGENIFCILRPS
jgi:FkbM family methyltransferase